MTNWEEIQREWETTKITFKALAEKYDVPEGTLKSRRSREKWHRKKDATKKKKDASVKKVATIKEPVNESDKLNDKQMLFCIYYIKYFNATKAYQKAYGCAYSTAMVQGHRSLRNTKISSEIDRMREEALSEKKISADDILQKYIDIAFSDITDFVEFGTEEVPGGELEEELTGVDQSYIANYVRFKNDFEVDGTIITEVRKGKDGVSVKLADKMKALEMLAKYTDLLSENDKKRLQEEKLKADTVKARAEANRIEKESSDEEIEDIVIVDEWSDDDDSD